MSSLAQINESIKRMSKDDCIDVQITFSLKSASKTAIKKASQKLPCTCAIEVIDNVPKKIPKPSVETAEKTEVQVKRAEAAE